MKRTVLLGAAALAAGASAVPFTFWNMSAYGVSNFSEFVFETGEDSQGGFYQLVRQPAALPVDLTVVKFGAFQVQEFVASTGMTPVGNADMAVAPNGETYVVMSVAHPSGQEVKLVKFKASGSPAWTRSLGVFKVSFSAPRLRVIVDGLGSPIAATCHITAPQTVSTRISRFSAASGSVTWSKLFAMNETLGPMAASSSVVAFVADTPQPTLRGLNLSSGAISWTSTVSFPIQGSINTLLFSSNAGRYYATGVHVDANGSRGYIAGISTTGALNWRRLDAINGVRTSVMRIATNGDAVDFVGLPGPSGRIERVNTSGILGYATTVPNITTMPNPDGLSLDPANNVFLVHKNSQETTVRISRFSSACVFDWQLSEGAPSGAALPARAPSR